MELLIVDCEVRSEAVVVSARGEVDSNTAEQLTEQLDAALRQAATHARRLVILDLDGLTYFGSSGLNAVLQCHGNGAEAGTAVRVVAESVVVVRPIEVTKLDRVLSLYRTLSDALQGSSDP
jgi:anti-anti-sigma factor